MVVVTLAGREPENDQYIKHTIQMNVGNGANFWPLQFTFCIIAKMTMTSLKEKEKPDNSDSFNLFSAVFKQKSMFNFFFF